MPRCHKFIVARCRKCNKVTAAATAEEKNDEAAAVKESKKWLRRGDTVACESVYSTPPFPEWCECNFVKAPSVLTD